MSSRGCGLEAATLSGAGVAVGVGVCAVRAGDVGVHDAGQVRAGQVRATFDAVPVDDHAVSPVRSAEVRFLPVSLE